MVRTDFGEGPPDYVWLHGWGQDRTALAPLARLLDGHHILFDLPGFGESRPLAPGAGTEDYAHALRENLARRNHPRILVGHSFGCRVAVQFARHHPGEADALVFIAGAGIPRSRGLAWRLRAGGLKLLGRLAGLTDRLFQTHLKEAYARRFGSRDYREAGPLRETFVRTVNEDLTELCRDIRLPVLLIYGEEDTETPMETGEKFADAFPHASLKILPHFGHHDILTRGQHRLQDLIRRFAARFEKEAGP